MIDVDLSGLSRARLCARLVKLEVLGALSRVVSDALADRLRRAERENAALYRVIERQVTEATELRRQLANVTPFTALDALRAAPGWQATAPTAEEVSAHGEAHPYGPEAAEGEEDSGDEVGGLWALRDAGGVGLAELYVNRYGWTMVLNAGAEFLRGECDLVDLARDERITGWLRLTADGRPVER